MLMLETDMRFLCAMAAGGCVGRWRVAGETDGKRLHAQEWHKLPLYSRVQRWRS